MACGVVPISTNHKGPSEIILNNTNGFLIKDDENIVDSILKRITAFKRLSSTEKVKFREKSINRGKYFYKTNIKLNWEKLLKEL